MDKTRLETLLKFLENNPKDFFARYGVAMEYAKYGETTKAVQEFRSLWEMNPDYIAAYFQAGKLLAQSGNPGAAREILLQGIEAAARTNNLHAKSEMEAEMEQLSSS